MCTLSSRALVFRNGDRTLAVRRGSQSVTCGWPEVECGGVCHDLDGIGIDDEAFPNDSVDSHTHGESLKWKLGYGKGGHEKRKLTRLSQIATSFGSHLKRT